MIYSCALKVHNSIAGGNVLGAIGIGSVVYFIMEIRFFALNTRLI
jgi:hypothetical protein